MSPLVLLCVALAGGVGAVLRFLVDLGVRSRFAGSFPAGTLVINVTGSFVIGLGAGLMPAGVLPELHAVLATGLLGGYTTFSTASFETVRLLQRRAPGLALANAFGMLAVAVAATLLGLLLGAALAGSPASGA